MLPFASCPENSAIPIDIPGRTLRLGDLHAADDKEDVLDVVAHGDVVLVANSHAVADFLRVLRSA